MMMNRNATPWTGIQLPQRPDLSDHGILHLQSLRWIEEMVDTHRDRLGIDRSWRFSYQVLCPQDMFYHEGIIWWESEMKVVRLTLRCDLSQDLAEHVLLAKLFELADWELHDLTLTMLDYIEPAALREHLLKQYRMVRTRAIEQRVTLYRGQSRPFLVMGDDPLDLSPTTHHRALVLRGDAS